MAKRSYFEEIKELSNTWKNVSECYTDLRQISKDWLSGDCYCIGSGGSYSLAKLWELVYESNGAGFAKALTPYEFHNRDHEPDLIVLFSASGKNHDILEVYRVAIEKKKKVLIFTVSQNSILAQLSRQDKNSKIVCTSVGIPSDGFLAVNSVVAISYLILKLEEYLWQRTNEYDSMIETAISEHVNFVARINNMSLSYLYILASGWSSVAGLDLESRFAESAIAPCLLTDQRNFGHGRFMWFENFKEDTHMVVFSSPFSKSLTNRLLKQIPPEVVRINVISPSDSSWGAVYSLVRSILLFGDYARKLGKDPGKPNVPEWGRKIHRLKSNVVSRERQKISKDKCNKYSRPENIPFDALVFDYDGTLVNTKERYEPIKPEMLRKLNRLLNYGIEIGVATGRGKSAFNALKSGIEKIYHEYVVVGMYNGTILRKLSENLEPRTENWHLRMMIYKYIEFRFKFNSSVEISLKNTQISIRNIEENEKISLIRDLMSVLGQHSDYVKFVSSAHSLDILPSWASKINLVQSVCSRLEMKVLCVGDQGQIGGNDEELLSWFPSISVGSKQPSNPECIWIGKEKEYREVNGVLYLLDSVESEGGNFTINLGKMCNEN